MALVLLGVALRAPSLWVPILNEDEALYAVTAAGMAAGEPPYRAGVESKPPGVFYLYEGAFALVGRYQMTRVHALTIPWALATALFVGLIAWYAGGGAAAAAWASLFYLVFSTVQDPKVLASQCELLYSLPLSIAALLLVLRLRRDDAARHVLVFAAGALVALGTLIKPTAISLLGAGGVALIVGEPLTRGRRAIPGALASGVALVAGFASVWLAAAWYFTGLGVWGDLVYWAFRWTLGMYIPTGHAEAFFWHRCIASFLPWLLLTPVLWGLAARATTHLLRKRSTLDAPVQSRMLILLATWAGAALMVLMLGGRFYDHYFPQIVPPLAALAGLGAASLLEEPRPATRRRAIAFIVLGTAVPALLCLVAACNFERTEALLEDRRAPHAAISRYLATHSRPDERVFVWGYYPTIYVDADRLAASRFVGCHYLTGYAAVGLGRVISPALEDRLGSADGFVALLEDFSRHPPALIVDTAPANIHGWSHYPLDRYPSLAAYLTERYERAAVVDGAVIYRRAN